MSNPMQPLDPAAAPDPVTPADSPSNPSGFAQVTPAGRGPAPYDIQAPMEDLSGLVASAGALAGAGVIYPQGPRQAGTEHMLGSPQGYGAQDIQAGYSGGGGEDWPNDVGPVAQEPYIYPGAYPGTTQGDVPKYGA